MLIAERFFLQRQELVHPQLPLAITVQNRKKGL